MLGIGQCPVCGNPNIVLVKSQNGAVLKEHKRRGRLMSGATTCEGSGRKPK
jgi:hypothetical protein